jgi:aminoglycoside phosphotransferase family enzyme
MTPETITQYQIEEHTLISKRIKAARYMIKDLLDAMMHDPMSEPEKISSLANELAEYHQSKLFLRAKSMGAIVKTSLKVVLQKNKQHFATKNDFLKY